MKEAFWKRIVEKIKTDRKTRNTVICAGIGVVLVLAAAVTVPVMLHNRISVVQEAEQKITTTESTTDENTTAAPTSETSAETTVAAVAEATEPTSTQAASSTTGKKENTQNAVKPAVQGTNGGSTAQTPQGNTTNAQTAEQQIPAKKQWTQAEVDALVVEMKQYAQSKGFTIKSSLTTQGTSWQYYADTTFSEAFIRDELKQGVDDVYDMGMNRFGYIPKESYLNIVTQQYTDSDGYTQWEIYVVY